MIVVTFRILCVIVCTIVTGSVGHPVRGTQMSWPGRLHDDVLNVSPGEKRAAQQQFDVVMLRYLKTTQSFLNNDIKATRTGEICHTQTP